MFSGIVADVGIVDSIQRRTSGLTLTVKMPSGLETDTAIGASVAIDGVCLTVTEIHGELLSFDSMSETLAVTTLGGIAVGSRVNVERSITVGSEIGGHFVSGHIDCRATVVSRSSNDSTTSIGFVVPKQWGRYLIRKGYIAVNGASLTLGEVDRLQGKFEVHLIPETLRRTTFDTIAVGDEVNIEMERQTVAIIDTVLDFLSDEKPRSEL